MLQLASGAILGPGHRDRHMGRLDEAERVQLSTYFTSMCFRSDAVGVDPAATRSRSSRLSLNWLSPSRPTTWAALRPNQVPDNVDRFGRTRRREGAPTSSGSCRWRADCCVPAGALPRLEIVEHHAFRITPQRDFEVEEDRDEDLLQALERELARRRFLLPGPLEFPDDMTEKHSWNFCCVNSTSTPVTSSRCQGCWISRRCGRSTVLTAPR